MPLRAPIDPFGYYHVGIRGSYGQPLFRAANEYELFLSRYERTSAKYGWDTLDWILMPNHHHFVVKLHNGGLSEGMRELHGGYSRQIHAIYGMTGTGHLVKHGFFARRLTTDRDVIGTCRYVDLNFCRAANRPPEESRRGGYRAIVGLAHPRRFHSPHLLLELVDRTPERARAEYRRLVLEGFEAWREEQLRDHDAA